MISKILGGLVAPFLISSLVFASDKALLDKGKKIFLSNCIQCHNKDPNKKGSLGPELIDTPLEVMIYKVTTGKYPPKLPAGFIPKRKTKAMRSFPKLRGEIPAIHAWIQSVKVKK